jgi:hypothetical protein
MADQAPHQGAVQAGESVWVSGDERAESDILYFRVLAQFLDEIKRNRGRCPIKNVENDRRDQIPEEQSRE